MKKSLAALGILWAGTGWAVAGPPQSAAAPTPPTEEVLVLPPLKVPVPASAATQGLLPDKAPAASATPPESKFAKTSGGDILLGDTKTLPPASSVTPPSITVIDATPAGRGLGIAAGAGIYMLQPRFSSNPALLSNTN